MSAAEILIDLSQFVCQPVKSGIQRLLVELIREWPSVIVSAEVGYCTSGEYTIVSLEHAKSVLLDHFEFDATSPDARQKPDAVKGRFDTLATTRIPAGDIAGRYSSYLLPEPTFRDEVLDTLHCWNSDRPARCFAIFFDALPQTNPEFFKAPHQLGTSRYYREVASVENIACISEASLNCLVERLRRRPVSNAVVLRLGTDRFAAVPPRSLPATPTFVSVGTIEPRKNHSIILEAFNELWRGGSDYRLHFIGAPGWHTDEFLKELSDRSVEDPRRFQWTQEASDTTIRDALAQSTGAIYLSEAEGFGLPAAEALAAGCPLIAAASLPALENLPPLGHIRLNMVTIQSIKTAVQSVADPHVNKRLREEATQLRLPTWRDCVHELVAWMRRTIDRVAEEEGASAGLPS